MVKPAVGSRATPIRAAVTGGGWLRRYATAAIAAVLLGISLFAVWSAGTTALATREAAAAIRLSDDYADAAAALSSEETLETAYRMEPGPGVRATRRAAAVKLTTALADVSTQGGPADRALVQQVSQDHWAYLALISQLFDAVDAKNAQRVTALDTQADVLLTRIQRLVDDAAAAQHQRALRQLARLQRLETTTSRLTPLLFALGLLVVSALASVLRSHSRLDVARRDAVHTSQHDALTGLPNRILLAHRVDDALSGRSDQAFALLLVDLDRFKEVNDTLGHHYGDALLAQVGHRLTALLTDANTVARLGGDEFAVLVPIGEPPDAARQATSPSDCRVGEAGRIASVIVDALRRPFTVEDVDLLVDASIGVVVSGEHGDDYSTLLRRADVAMYAAKASGLGWRLYEPSLDESKTPGKLAILADLRRAIEQQQLVLHYQPKINIRTGVVTGVEALVRWQHPERGLLPPSEFIPAAEYSGLIHPLTSYVLNAALAQARRWMDAERPLLVSVNLSGRSLLNAQLPIEIEQHLVAHQVPASLLELEVTESALMAEPERAQQVLTALADLGVHLSIDDFGVGYTSIGMLRDLPIDELKIDKSFVLTLSDDPVNTAIVHSIVNLGHDLGLTVVAEGVEVATAMTILSEQECDLAQGFYLSKPMPASAFDAWYHAREVRPVSLAVPD